VVCCALTAWKTHREATSQIARGQDRQDPRAAGNRFQSIRENTVDGARIVEARCDGWAVLKKILKSTARFDNTDSRETLTNANTFESRAH